MNKAEKKERKKILILFSLIVALLLIILFSAIFYIRASRPMRQAKEEAIQLAKEHVDIQRVDQFYWFTREETYFSLVGETEAGKNVVVIIPKTGEKLLVFDEPCQGMDEEQIRFFNNLVDDLAEAGQTLIYVGHFESQLPKKLSHKLELHEGKVKSNEELKMFTQNSKIDCFQA